jgi:hypothetical protein
MQRWSTLIYPLNNVNYALVLLLLKKTLFGAKLKNNVTGNQNGMPILQYFTIIPCDLEGAPFHHPNDPNVEPVPLPIS